MHLRAFFSLFLLFCSVYLFSEEPSLNNAPEPVSLVNMTAAPSSFVNNSVSAISGDYIQTGVEYVVSGPDPYVLGHTYTSSNMERGNLSHAWAFQHNYLLKVFQPRAITYTGNPDLEDYSNPYTRIFLYEPHGGKVLFKGDGKARHFRPVLKKTGYTNVGAGEVSGKTNIKNIHIHWDSTTDQWHVKAGDGSERIYARRSLQKKHRAPGRYNYHFRDYHIIQENKPSGNIVLYSYNDDRKIEKIKTISSDKAYILNWVRFSYTDKQIVDVSTSDGLNFSYKLKKIECLDDKERFVVSRITRPGVSPEYFEYDEESNSHEPRIEKSYRKDGNFLETKYYREGSNTIGELHLKIEDKKRRRFLKNRVRQQSSPVGIGGEPVITHAYFYNRRNEGDELRRTIVVDPFGNATKYYYDAEKHLKGIKREENHIMVLSEDFTYGKKESEYEGQLLSRSLYDEQKRLILKRCYEYDDHGNVIKEIIQGNFGEEGKEASERVYRYSYSTNGWNLKLSARDPQGNYTYYEYKKGTNLLTARFSCERKIIKKREFFSYDSQANLISEIVDDGSTRNINDLQGVTERAIKRYTPRRVTPHFGAPVEILELYLDMQTKEEKQLSRTVNIFDNKGLVQRKEIYDSTNLLHGFSEYSYDQVGRVTYSKDALGREEFYSYDALGRLSSKNGPRLDVETQYEYDIAGRLSKEKELYQTGLVLSKQYRYDVLGRKIGLIDPQGNETTMSYDSLNRVTKISSAPFVDAAGSVVQTTRALSYQNAGSTIIETDNAGMQTVRSYTATGKLIQEKFPDGTVKKYFYDILDRLVKEVEPNGLVSLHQYDYNNRITETKQVKDGRTLACKRMVYNAFHVIEQIGPSGERALFTYDNAGRKTSSYQPESGTAGRLITYHYDAVGRLSEERQQLESGSYLAKKLEYDLLGRVTSESVHDEKGCVFSIKGTCYDVEGNVAATLQSIQGKISKTTTLYHPHGVPSTITDALGNVTTFEVDYFYRNELGQYVLKKTATDARGVKNIEILNAKGQPVENSRFDPYNKQISLRKSFYDVSSNLVRTEESALSDRDTRVITTLFTYGPLQRLEKIIEAAGTPEQKETRLCYNNLGQKEVTILADGVKLYNLYDENGRVERYFDAAHTIDYHYNYDASDRILSVTNALTGKSTLRTYNIHGDLVSETLENGVITSYNYDRIGRVVSVALPDSSQVAYTYSPAFLQTVTKIAPDGTAHYQYEVLSRDLSGHILEAQLPGKAGIVHYDYDLVGRVTKVGHPLFQQSVPESGYDPVGNLTSLSVRDPLGMKLHSFGYDFLSQLTMEDGAQSHRYQYDSLYNRLEMDTTSYSVNALHAVTQSGNDTYAYDPNGNRKIKVKDGQSTAYIYDSLDRLTAIETSDRYVEYGYDAFHRRTSKKIFTKRAGSRLLEKEDRFLYLQDNEVGSMDSSGTITELRLLGEGGNAEIGASIAFELNQKMLIPLHDHRGNVAMLISASTGKLENYYRYTAFGEEELFNKLLQKESTTCCPWRFSSKRTETIAGDTMVFFGRRYYDPSLGKWLTQDPLGLKAGPNLYAYVQNNPLTHIDLYGLFETAMGEMAYEFTTCGSTSGSSGNAGHSASDRSGRSDLHNFVGSAVGAVAGLIDTVIYHCVPCNPVTDFVRGALCGIAGRTGPVREHSGTLDSIDNRDVIRAVKNNQPIRIGINGILNTQEEVQQNKEYFKTVCGLSGEVQIIMIHSASAGFISDMIELALNRLGIVTHAVTVLVDTINSVAATASKVGSGYTIDLIAHSQGAAITDLALKQLSPEILAHINVSTFGATKIISKNEHGVASAVNFISRSDWATGCCDIIGFAKACINPSSMDVKFVGSALGIPFSTHAFQGSTYQRAFRAVAEGPDAINRLK